MKKSLKLKQIFTGTKCKESQPKEIQDRAHCPDCYHEPRAYPGCVGVGAAATLGCRVLGVYTQQTV